MLIVWHYVITCYNAYHCYMFKKYTCWIPIGYCKQLVMVMAVFFRAVPGKSSKSCQEPSEKRGHCRDSAPSFRSSEVAEGIRRTRPLEVTLWLFNIAMENGPFIDGLPVKTSIYKGFSMAMLNNQMVTSTRIWRFVGSLASHHPWYPWIWETNYRVVFCFFRFCVFGQWNEHTHTHIHFCADEGHPQAWTTGIDLILRCFCPSRTSCSKHHFHMFFIVHMFI